VTPIPARQHHSAQTNQDAAGFSTVDAQAAKPIALRPSPCAVPPMTPATMIHRVAVRLASDGPPGKEGIASARAGHGDRYVSEQQARAELKHVNREIRRLRAELAALRERRAKLDSDLGT
jgi:hypothetical protein